MAFSPPSSVDVGELFKRYYAGQRDFSGADFRRCGLSMISLEGCDFSRANMRDVEFDGSRFEGCSFDGADLRGCHIHSAASFYDTTFDSARLSEGLIANSQFTTSSLKGVSFDRTRLYGVSFQSCSMYKMSLEDARLRDVSLVGCNASESSLSGAAFHDSDLGWLIETPSCTFARAPVFMDYLTIRRSVHVNGFDRFLDALSWPIDIATYLITSSQRMKPEDEMVRTSTFISYGAPDESFARRVRDDLHRRGVRTFLFAIDAVPGQPLYRVMREGINTYDHVIVVCSEASLTRNGVRNEIEEALRREARRGGTPCIIPITLDNFVFSWSDAVGESLRDRVIGDFRQLDTYPQRFAEGVSALLQALLRTPGA